jgi:hypothetical protein
VCDVTTDGGYMPRFLRDGGRVKNFILSQIFNPAGKLCFLIQISEEDGIQLKAEMREEVKICICVNLRPCQPNVGRGFHLLITEEDRESAWRKDKRIKN